LGTGVDDYSGRGKEGKGEEKRFVKTLEKRKKKTVRCHTPNLTMLVSARAKSDSTKREEQKIIVRGTSTNFSRRWGGKKGDNATVLRSGETVLVFHHKRKREKVRHSNVRIDGTLEKRGEKRSGRVSAKKKRKNKPRAVP